MKSLKELYRIGPGPSSSHTLGPQRACLKFKEAFPSASYMQADLFGSLALTGKGHGTDTIIKKTMQPISCEVIFHHEEVDLPHPNTMKLSAYDAQKKGLGEWTVCSIGGGAIRIIGVDDADGKEIYPQESFAEIKAFCILHELDLAGYVDNYEALDDYLETIFYQMLETVKQGLETEGVLPGKLKLKRTAGSLYQKAKQALIPSEKEKLLLSAYAYAASEENAGGGMTVTAPTLGSSGILPSLLYYHYFDLHMPLKIMINGLKVAGIFGNLIKQNATISGAQGGCQAEIGAACAMGAAMAAYFRELPIHKIEYAAEMGIEHHLGLTCDPVGGYVMIPCIERNAVAVLRSMDAAFLSTNLLDVRDNVISFDMVVNTMQYTGKKLAIELRETSLGGLALEVPLEEDE